MKILCKEQVKKQMADRSKWKIDNDGLKLLL